jgi:hypothetical protein
METMVPAFDDKSIRTNGFRAVHTPRGTIHVDLLLLEIPIPGSYVPSTGEMTSFRQSEKIDFALVSTRLFLSNAWPFKKLIHRRKYVFGRTSSCKSKKYLLL